MVKNQKGITLVELLAVVALTGLLTTAIFQMLSVNTTSMNYSQVKTQLQREAAIAFESLQNAAYDAQNVSVVQGESNTQVKICTTGEPNVIDISNKLLTMNEIIIAREIKQATVAVDRDIMTIDLVLSRMNGKHEVEYKETTNVRMRNYQEGAPCEISN